MKRIQEHLQMYGVKTLSTAELLAFILSSVSPQSDPLATASTLLENYGVSGLKNLGDAEFSGLGLTKAKARVLQVVCELAVRLSLPDPQEPQKISSPHDAAAVLRPFMEHLDHEEFRVLVLNSGNRVVANVLLYQGTVDSTAVRSCEIFREAITRKCPRVIVAHNHPGSNQPSPEDCDFTRQLVESSKVLEIELLDHLVICRSSFFVSLKEQMKW